MIRNYFGASHLFVTLEAWHRDVTSVQWKLGPLVHRQCEACDLERGTVVALLAPVIPRSGSKLPFMLVSMAVDTEGVLNLESRILPSWDMA